jgi:hypothetical protein
VNVSLLTTLLLLVPGDGPPTDAELMQKAEAEFTEGLRRREAGEKSRRQFRAAAAAYEELLLQRGASNGLLYRNLGNARLLAGDLPRAILAYRKGLRIAPGSRILRECLEAARERVAFQEGSRLGRAPEDLRPPWLAGLSAGWVFALAVLTWTVGWAALTRWLMRRHRLMMFLGGVLLILAATLGGLLFYRERGERDRPIVVIAADGVLLRKGNGRLFPPRYETPLNRGVEAQLLFRRDRWLQIELSGGEVGWVAETEAVVE